MDRRGFITSLSATAFVASAPGVARRPASASARLTLHDLSVMMRGLDRPEGIAVDRRGRVVFSDHNAAVTIIDAGGRLIRRGTAVAPCGVVMDRDGHAILANMGLLSGAPGILQRIDITDGTSVTLADAIDGRALVASNNPCAARDGTIFCTHSSWVDAPRIGKTLADGFVYRVPAGGGIASPVATGIRGANGCCLDRDERHLYVASTPEARIYRYRRLPDGGLGPREAFGPPLGKAVPDQTISEIRALPRAARAELGYCDGIAFDEAGNLWITLPFANRIVALTPAGMLVPIFDDPDGSLIDMPTNIAWGGPDRRDLFIVSRATNAIVRGRTNVRGLARVA